MKIAIRSKDGKTVSDSVTSFSGYLVYELDGDRVVNSEFRKCNPAKSDEKRYIGDCETIISKAISPNETKSLRKKGKEVLITFKTSPEEALRSFIRQKIYMGSFAQ